MKPKSITILKKNFRFLCSWAIIGLEWERGSGPPEFFKEYDEQIKLIKDLKRSKK